MIDLLGFKIEEGQFIARSYKSGSSAQMTVAIVLYVNDKGKPRVASQQSSYRPRLSESTIEYGSRCVVINSADVKESDPDLYKTLMEFYEQKKTIRSMK